MANVTQNQSRKWAKPGALMGVVRFPTQGSEDFYAMTGLTKDSSGRVGAFTAAERLVGLASPDVQSFDFSKASASQPGFDVPVVYDGQILVGITGASHKDLQRAVFMSDNNTFTFSPIKGKYVGKTVAYDTGEAKLWVALDLGNECWDSWFDIAAEGYIDLPNTGQALVQLAYGNVTGAVGVKADGTFDIHYTTTGGIVDSTGTTLLVADNGTNVRLTNESAATIRLAVRYMGIQL